MVRIGLTGGIGSGKSTVARLLAEHGAVIIDADQLARQVVAPGTRGLAEIAEHFGTGVLQADGGLDRASLAAIVFADPQQRSVLEGITHPQIKQLTKERFAQAADGDVVVHDMPLLVEQGLSDNYDLVVVVHVPLERRIERLMNDRAMSRQEAQSRIDSQATDAQRARIADEIVDNSGDLDDLAQSVNDLWVRRIEPMQRTHS
ncbi:dephospho-CoA kinase, long form [Ornithinimicrobium sp. Arc0846-15]|nr:dephospho-CoA kinase, long form [Ornithinimicrobium laminariae]